MEIIGYPETLVRNYFYAVKYIRRAETSHDNLVIQTLVWPFMVQIRAIQFAVLRFSDSYENLRRPPTLNLYTPCITFIFAVSLNQPRNAYFYNLINKCTLAYRIVTVKVWLKKKTVKMTSHNSAPHLGKKPHLAFK